MPGRGIDQILPRRSNPELHEPLVKDATAYVGLAEAANGPVPRPVSYDYIWGDALESLRRRRPALRVINLETSITVNDEPWPKGINYRLHPANISCITAADVDCCVLANNHVLDWGEAGLIETLDSLHGAGIRTAGAGRSLGEASGPAVFELTDEARVLVFGFGCTTSGIPRRWAATEERPGVNLLPQLSALTVRDVAQTIQRHRKPGDLVIASLHWGGNWGYTIPREQQHFAHGLVDHAGIDIVHGHSSHHPKGIELYRGKPIIYGCGDLLNDYEGISGYESYRGDLSLMYFVTMDVTTGELLDLQMEPFQIRRFRLQPASGPDALWLHSVLQRECAKLGTNVKLTEDGSLALYR